MNDSFDKTISGGKFDEVFTEVSHSETLGLKNPEQLRLFHLNVNNNAFSSDQLEVFLRKNMASMYSPVPGLRIIELKTMCLVLDWTLLRS